MRLEADAPPRTCGEHWSLQFLQDYPRFVYRIDNPKELAREAAEDRVALTGWFAGLKEIIEVNNIEVRDTYNYDETGIRLGIGKKEKVIVEATRGRIESGTSTTRESCTLGECISADGDVAPPLLVLKGKTHQMRWYTQSLIPDNYLVEVNESAYMNDQLALEWVKHFDAWSSKRQKGLWRLLILDGHTTHGTREIIEYCDDRKILIFPMLPHTTQLCQPLDVVCFQPYKYWYGQAVLGAYATGCTEFDKMEFLNAIHGVRMNAFKHSTIIASFKETGIVPFNPSIVINKCPLPLPPPPARPSTPPQPDWDNITTPKTANSLKRFGDHIMANWQDNRGWAWTVKYMKGSQAIAYAGNIQHRQLARTRAAEKVRNNSSLLSRVTVPHTGPLLAKDARKMREKECEESIEAMEIRIEMRRKKRDNKRQKEEEAIAIAERKRVRAANKLLGIATPRYRKPK